MVGFAMIVLKHTGRDLSIRHPVVSSAAWNSTIMPIGLRSLIALFPAATINHVLTATNLSTANSFCMERIYILLLKARKLQKKKKKTKKKKKEKEKKKKKKGKEEQK